MNVNPISFKQKIIMPIPMDSPQQQKPYTQEQKKGEYKTWAYVLGGVGILAAGLFGGDYLVTTNKLTKNIQSIASDIDIPENTILHDLLSGLNAHEKLSVSEYLIKNKETWINKPEEFKSAVSEGKSQIIRQKSMRYERSKNNDDDDIIYFPDEDYPHSGDVDIDLEL